MGAWVCNFPPSVFQALIHIISNKKIEPLKLNWTLERVEDSMFLHSLRRNMKKKSKFFDKIFIHTAAAAAESSLQRWEFIKEE